MEGALFDPGWAMRSDKFKIGDLVRQTLSKDDKLGIIIKVCSALNKSEIYWIGENYRSAWQHKFLVCITKKENKNGKQRSSAQRTTPI